MKLRALTNVRPQKDLGKQLILAPTPGQFKLTPDAAKQLNVGAGDFVGIVFDDESGTGFVFKGSEDGLGAKTASSNKGGGGNLNFSAAAGWDELGGSADHNIHFDIADEAVEADELVDTPFEGLSLYAVTFAEKVEKQQRKSKDESEDADVDADAPIAQSVDSFDDL